jgi:DNA-binding response OmpR family regulator
MGEQGFVIQTIFVVGPATHAEESCLSEAGYSVVRWDDLRQALLEARRERPELLICDADWPEREALLTGLREAPETAGAAVVLVSDDGTYAARARALASGATGYLTRPVPPPLLLRKVERLGRGDSGGTPLPAGDAPLVSLLEAGEMGPQDLHDAALPDPYSLPALLRTVLVVDDDPAFRRLLVHFLTSQAFTVHEAADGREAVAAALQRRPWLILADLEMPGVDGLELCRQVRQHTLLRHTPFVFLSGWDDYKERYRGLSAGADDFLSKRTPLREILLRINLILRRFAEVGTKSRTGSAMEGRLDLVGPPALLQICHVARFSGTLSARFGAQVLEVRFSEGEITGATGAEAQGFDAVVELLSWERGYFEFVPGGKGGEALSESFEQLLLEACRQLDERGRPGGGSAHGKELE